MAFKESFHFPIKIHISFGLTGKCWLNKRTLIFPYTEPLPLHLIYYQNIFLNQHRIIYTHSALLKLGRTFPPSWPKAQYLSISALLCTVLRIEFQNLNGFRILWDYLCWELLSIQLPLLCLLLFFNLIEANMEWPRSRGMVK